ncbi:MULTISPECIES: GtrA family protein [Geodermatophilus]|uniref:Putative flippase GtrA (Transmembrane translocase of bactoprenol-linked glucose) n=1 Tax=Geodermatophilus nigrescens TaxID=1070870 RepID=A0A1M5N9T5_9ACTN|nr:GtrA family protein [Geodermatophilus nigrescens]SHG86268.1 Putative flippase GtrA (transmembrane translocase of bactoprenol-linked glucose) [Geodermatophilus nigrescens]
MAADVPADGIPADGPAREPARDGLLRQLTRFVAVGALSAVVDLGVYTLGLHLGLATWLARAISFVCGTTTAYVLNRRWAFGVEGGSRRVAGFVLLYGTTFGVVLAVNALALLWLPGRWWAPTLAWAVSQGVGTAVNFVVLRTVVFRR